jgi:hypothetical protein
MSLVTGEVHRVTLVLTAEAGDDDPSTWDWQSLLDSPYPVVVERNEYVGPATESEFA